MRTRVIEVDIDSPSLRILRYKQYDHNNLLKVIIKKDEEKMDLLSYTARVFFKLPDNSTIQRNVQIVNDEICIVLESIILQHTGRIPFEITLSNGKIIVTTFTMYVHVEESIDRNAIIEGSPEWDIIKDGLSVLDDKIGREEFDERLDKIEKEIDDKFENLDINNIDLDNYYNKDVIDNKLNTKADNLFQSSMPTITSLGGIQAGTDLNNMSIQDILTKLLYPYVAPTVSASLVYSPTGNIYERGQIVTISQLKTTVTKKTESILDISFYKNNSLLKKETTSVINGGDFNYTFTSETVTTSIPNTYFQVKVTDASKKIVTANTVALNFYYPYYYGVIGVNDEVTQELIKSLTKNVVAKGTKTYTFNTDYQRMVIAYPKSYGRLKSILDTNGFEQLNSFMCIELPIVGLDKTTQTYYVYVNDASTNTNFKMSFYY